MFQKMTTDLVLLGRHFFGKNDSISVQFKFGFEFE
jgi:hypothetical protein